MRQLSSLMISHSEPTAALFRGVGVDAVVGKNVVVGKR